MEIRYFQIIIPLLSLLLIGGQIRGYLKSNSGIYETVLISIFWISICVLSLFPDLVSNVVAKIFGIKNNVNAVIFFAIGLLFYFQLQLYKVMKKQDELLTELTRKLALEEAENSQSNKH